MLGKYAAAISFSFFGRGLAAAHRGGAHWQGMLIAERTTRCLLNRKDTWQRGESGLNVRHYSTVHNLSARSGATFAHNLPVPRGKKFRRSPRLRRQTDSAPHQHVYVRITTRHARRCFRPWCCGFLAIDFQSQNIFCAPCATTRKTSPSSWRSRQ